MKRLIILLLIPAIAFAQNTDRKLTLDTKASTLMWRGENFGGASGHDGTLKASAGFLQISDGQPTGGEFVVDMTSLKNTDQHDKKNQRELEDHLKNDDFFSVKTFPKAFFVIAAVIKSAAEPNQYMITGLLTIKGIGNTVTFPANIVVDKGGARGTGEIKLDRTKWNITFKSKSIFAQLKEGALSDEISVKVDLIFKGK